MELASTLDWLQGTSLAVWIRDSLFVFPLLESAHVIGLTLVFGTIAIVDLRLLGIASTTPIVSAAGVRHSEVDVGRLRPDRCDRRADVHHERLGVLPQRLFPREGGAAGAGGHQRARVRS